MKIFWNAVPRQVVKAKQQYGDVYFSFTEEGWTGMQHAESVHVE